MAKEARVMQRDGGCQMKISKVKYLSKWSIYTLAISIIILATSCTNVSGNYGTSSAPSSASLRFFRKEGGSDII